MLKQLYTGPNAYANLRKFNLFMGMLHLVQGIVMVVVSNDTTASLTTSFLKGKVDGENFISETVTKNVFDLRLGYAVALFLFISAAAHFLIASPYFFDWYKKNLMKGANFARWHEYSLSASWMIVIIAVLCGMYDAPSLILLFFLNACMIWFGYMMELYNLEREKTDWTSFIFGCIAGIVPWIVLGWYFFDAISNVESQNPVPDFVYGILISLFIFFNIFAVNMYLQYKKIGPWKNYLFGETMYIVLSLVAKSALAWQVFSGTLR